MAIIAGAAAILVHPDIIIFEIRLLGGLRGQAAPPSHIGVIMTENSQTTPGMVHGVASCVCAVLGFFIPFIGLILAVVGLVLGLRAFKTGKANGNDTVNILGLIGAIISGISIVVGIFSMIALIGGIGLLGLMGGSNPW